MRRRGEWFFVGQDHLRRGVRIFYLSRVAGARVGAGGGGDRASGRTGHGPRDPRVGRLDRQLEGAVTAAYDLRRIRRLLLLLPAAASRSLHSCTRNGRTMTQRGFWSCAAATAQADQTHCRRSGLRADAAATRGPFGTAGAVRPARPLRWYRRCVRHHKEAPCPAFVPQQASPPSSPIPRSRSRAADVDLLATAPTARQGCPKGTAGWALTGEEAVASGLSRVLGLTRTLSLRFQAIRTRT